MMNPAPSPAWTRLFPGPQIPEILTYVSVTWTWLQTNYAGAVAFEREEPELTDNLCEALNDYNRRLASAIACDFQSETWELRRCEDGQVTRVARADIRVILGVPGTPQLVLEFKKLDGSAGARWRYCFDGMSRFVEGKYAAHHEHGVMCGLTCAELSSELQAIGEYISDPARAAKLKCVTNARGGVIGLPSRIDPSAHFDTEHERHEATIASGIVLFHLLISCRKAAVLPTKS
jgi:hypothetical protein